MRKIKIQVSLKNYCLGQKHCQSISENQRKQVMNDWTAKAVLSSSRYSRFTVYGLPTIFYLSYFHVNLISPQKIRVSAMFSKHSVVKVTVPSAAFFQIHHPPMTFDNGFAHRFRFKSVWKRIMTVKNTRQNSLLKKEDCLKFKIQAIQTCFIPFPALSGLYAYR